MDYMDNNENEIKTNPELNNENKDSEDNNGEGSSVIFMIFCLLIIVAAAIFFVINNNQEKEDKIETSKVTEVKTSDTSKKTNLDPTSGTQTSEHKQTIIISRPQTETSGTTKTLEAQLLDKIPNKSFFADSTNSSNINKIECLRKITKDDGTKEEVDCNEYYGGVQHNGITSQKVGNKYILIIKNAYFIRGVGSSTPLGPGAMEISVYGQGSKILSHAGGTSNIEKNINTYPSYRIVFEKVGNDYVWKSTEVLK